MDFIGFTVLLLKGSLVLFSELKSRFRAYLPNKVTRTLEEKISTITHVLWNLEWRYRSIM